MTRILNGHPCNAALIAAAGITLIGLSLTLGTGSFGELFTAWSGSLAGFACTMLALVMFTRGMRRSLRSRSPQSAATQSLQRLALPAPAIPRTRACASTGIATKEAGNQMRGQAK